MPEPSKPDAGRLRPWFSIFRIGLVQAAIGAVVVFATSTLNRLMTVEYALPAVIPGALVGFHYAVQMLRPRWGHGSDQSGRRFPWIIGGMLVLASSAVLAAYAVTLLTTMFWVGLALAVLAYACLGIGVGAAGTSVLLLLAQTAGAARRPAAATLVWMMMIAGFIVTAGVAGHMLAPFSPARLMQTAAVVCGGALAVVVAAMWDLEPPRAVPKAPRLTRAAPFGPALRDVWSEPESRRFTLFVFLSMLAYSAQELILEPFAGTVFALTPADSARLAGLQHTGLLAGMVLVAVLGSVIGGPRLGSMRIWTTAGCIASAFGALALAGVGEANASALLRPAVVGLGAANGAFSISAVAGMMQLAGNGQPGREGVRMGLWGAAQALAFACGGLAGTGASDVARYALGSPSLAYAATFVGEAVLFCLAAGLAMRAFPQPVSRTSTSEAAPDKVRRWAT